MDVALIDELIETFFLLFFIVLSYFEMSTSEEEVWDVVVMCNSRGHSSVEFFYIFFLVSVCGSHLNGGGNQFCFDMLVIIFNANESPISQQPLSIAIQAVQSSF